MSRRRRRLLVVERELAGDRPLGAVDVLHQPAQGRVFFVERKLLHHDVDLGLQILRQIAVLGGQLLHQPAQGAVGVVERELLEQPLALLLKLRLDVRAQHRQQALRLVGAEPLDQRAVFAHVRQQRLGQPRIVAVEQSAQQRGQLAVVGGEPLARRWLNRPPSGSKYSLSEMVSRSWALPGVVVEILAQRVEQPRRLALDEFAVERRRGAPQREHADLERFQRVLVALGPVGIVHQRRDHVAVFDPQVRGRSQRAARPLSVRGATCKTSDMAESSGPVGAL